MFNDTWFDRLVRRLRKLVLPVAIIVIAIVVLTGYIWLMATSLTTAWCITAIVVNIAALVLGGIIHDNTHNCVRREVATCVHCSQSDKSLQQARKTEEQVRQIVDACVFRSQQDLDELLAIFGEKVQKLCEAEGKLNEKYCRAELPPKEQAELQRLHSEINRYRRAYSSLREQAPKFQLFVAEGWSTYFPERPAA